MANYYSINDIQTLNDIELKEITENPKDYNSEIVMEAYNEIEKREIQLSNNLTNSSSIPDFIFPEKPSLEEKTVKNAGKSFFSLALFIAAFYFIFKWDIQYILLLALAILIHELGHYLAMRIYNYKDVSIFFVPLMGAFASGKKERISRKQNAIILLAGPVPGIFLGVILYFFALKFDNQLLIQFSNILVFLNLFNLLPIIPLDGGNLVRTLFIKSNGIINTIFVWISIIILIYFSVQSESYILLIVPGLLVMNLNSQSYKRKLIKELGIKGFDLNKSYKDLTNQEYWLIRDEVGKYINYYKNIIKKGYYNYANEEDKISKFINGIVHQQDENDLKISHKVLIVLLWIMCFLIPIISLILIKLLN